MMSRHHWKDVIIRHKIPRIIRSMLYTLNHLTRPEVKIRAPRAAIRGHGLWSTI